MRPLLWHGVLLLAAGGSASFRSFGERIHRLTVETSNGPITGHEASNITDVIEFLGIPYAEPPVGELRFGAPLPYNKTLPYNASTWGFDCPQTVSTPVPYPDLTPQAERVISNFGVTNRTVQSENCLTLNVWTRKSCVNVRDPQPAARPVLVFFYGGRMGTQSTAFESFVSGNTNTPFYNGQYLADAEDVIVITFNYRINIFGFSGAPDAPQNVGLQDQRLAITWIRDNIASFGGDPNRITIFGQSAGGVAVDYWSYAYVSDPIVSGLISESGNAFSFPMNNISKATADWVNVASQLGCNTTSDTLACMRSKDWSDVRDAAAKVRGAPSGSPLRPIPAFTPVADGKLVFSNYTQLALSGTFARIPYLLGNNENEQGFYAIGAFAAGVNVTLAQGAAFLAMSFTCPTNFEANARFESGVPVWRYRYLGDWDNIRLYPGSGAYHGTELEMIFGASQDVSGIPPSPDEVKTTSLMQHAWATFARDPRSGLSKELGWPTYDQMTKSLIRLAYGNDPTPQFVLPDMYDQPCSTIVLGALQTGI